MRDLYLSSGHSNVKGKDRGAVSSDGTNIEGVLAVEFRDLLITEYKGKVFKDDNSNILADSIKYFKNLTKSNSLVVDIHFNAGPSAATGVEVLIPADYSDVELNLAKSIAKSISNKLGIPLRKSKLGVDGVKTELDSHHGRLGWMRLTGENVLLELCFISNPSEMKKYHDNKVALSKDIADILYQYANDNGSTSAVVVDKYVVVKGDTLSKISAKTGVYMEDLLLINKLKLTSVLQIGQVLKIK